MEEQRRESPTIWMRCPYPGELCGADATLTVTEISDEMVDGVLVCASGHRWRVAKLAESEELSA